MSEIENEQTN